MYKGNNPTAIASQKSILNSLNQLMEEKEYKDISVSELCNRSGVSRQTFYSLFGKKENVLLYQLELSYSSERNYDDDSVITLKETCKRYAKYVSSNYKHLKMMIENDLEEVISMYFYYAIFSCKPMFIKLNDEEREYASNFVASGLCRLTKTYIEKNKEVNSKELCKLSYKLLSGSIYQ